MSSPVKTSSFVVDSTWHRRHRATIARKSFFSSTVILILLLVIYIDVSYQILSSYFEISSWICSILELSLGFLLAVKILLNAWQITQYLWLYLFGGPIDLTEKQRRLLGVRNDEFGFRTSPPQQKKPASPENSLIFSTTMGSFANGEGSPHSMVQTLSPKLNSSFSPSPYSFYSSSSPFSPGFQRLSFDKTHSFSISGPSISFSHNENADGSFRSRHSPSPRSASTSPYQRISDFGTLKSFLQEQEEKELRSKQAAPENLNTNPFSFWSYGGSALDFTYTLRKYAYQLATPSPQSPAKTSKADLSSLTGMDEVWSKYGVTEDELYVWTEKLRKWLSSTIVSRLSQKIVQVNKQLQRLGCEDMQIGEVGITTLKQLVMTKGNMIQSLEGLVPYLEFSSNQEYLVRRIQDLSTGSMSEFTWNKGGSYSKPWAEHLPTDASLVMHLLCTYLDSRLPAQPRFLDGKVFTAQHFVKTPEKPDLRRKDNLLIVQTSINPPHFQVVIGSETFNLPKGRNNMFHAILLFFYHIKTKEGGMLGRINLGMSGLNILWIFE